MSSKKSGRCREVAVVERFKQESMYGMSAKKMALVERFKQESMYDLSAKKSGCCREAAISGGSTVTLPYRVQTFNWMDLTGWCFGGGFFFSHFFLFLFFPLHPFFLFPPLFFGFLPFFFDFALSSPFPFASFCLGPNSSSSASFVSVTVVFSANLHISLGDIAGTL